MVATIRSWCVVSRRLISTEFVRIDKPDIDLSSARTFWNGEYRHVRHLILKILTMISALTPFM